MSTDLDPHLLVSEIDLSIALPGAIVKDFRGNDLLLVGADYALPPSTGRIYVAEPGKHSRIDSFYPSVCNLRWTTGCIYVSVPGKHARIVSYYPSVCNLRWTTADGWKERMLADGAPEEAIEDMLAQAIDALTRKPYKPLSPR